jgi:hypothetical protein
MILRLTIICILILCTANVDAQINNEYLLSEEYKKMVSSYDIINSENNNYRTDSSKIRIECYYSDNVGFIYNELNDVSISYVTKIYLDTKTIEAFGKWVDGEDVGIWKFYAANGDLEQIRDYTKGTFDIIDTITFKFHKIRGVIKNNVDNRIIQEFGEDFFNSYVIWNLSGSGMRNNTEFGRWTDKFENPPTKFEIRYKVKDNNILDKKELVYSVDSNGNEIPRFFIK